MLICCSKVGNLQAKSSHSAITFDMTPTPEPKRTTTTPGHGSPEDQQQQPPFSFLGVQFAPLNTPWKRRLETLVVLYAEIEFIFGIFAFPVTVYIILFTRFYYLAFLYLVWLYADRETPRRGGRLVQWTRNLSIWKYFASYFPMTLVKTVDLDPSKNYIFGYHPHGIMGFGAFASFATNATGCDKLFPGIRTYVVTLETNFWLPLHRDIALARGLVDSSEESINCLLSNGDKGNAVVIVVGGAAESLDAVPNTMRLTLKSRKGFIRLALQNGASVVPVLSFGENELFSQSAHATNSWVRKFQNGMKRIVKFTFPLFHGRGLFQHSIGLLPYRQPVFTVVGAPIHVPKRVPKATKEEISHLHEEYLKGLQKLFDENKVKYASDPNLTLEFV